MPSITRRIRARREARGFDQAFDRALRTASPAMQQELLSAAARNRPGN